MENKPNIQNKIKFERFYVESLDYKCENIVDDDINEELEIGLKVSSAFSDKDLNSYLVKMDIELTSKNKVFSLNCKTIGYFRTTDLIDDNFKNSAFVKVNSPAILFPFIRSYIHTVTVNSGIPPVLLPSINFVK